MSTFSLSGSGTHALTASTTGLQVTITTPSSIGGLGRSNPTARYDQGLIRFSDGTAYWEPVPILGGPQFIPVPANASSIGYALLGGAVVSVTEVIGGTLFFSSPPASGLTDPTSAKGDLLVRGSSAVVALPVGTNTQVLTADSSATDGVKWAAAPAGTQTPPSILLTWTDTTDRFNATSITADTWTDLNPAQSFTVVSASSLILVSINANVMMGFLGSAVSVNGSILVDATTRYRLGGMHAPASNWGNPFAGAMPIPILGLSAGSHTVKAQIYSKGAGANVYAQFSSDPNQSYFTMRVLELP